ISYFISQPDTWNKLNTRKRMYHCPTCTGASIGYDTVNRIVSNSHCNFYNFTIHIIRSIACYRGSYLGIGIAGNQKEE
ncbi:MAG: hypothetical protein WD512_11755, partial [Candidatus Paceibacterota bacterium]